MLSSFSFTNKFKKPYKKPSNEPTESDLKRSSILAFRTITTMLSLIQCPIETTQIEPVDISAPKRKELRILDALAALLIREHEKVAVMAKPDGKSIQVISVVNLNLNNSEPVVIEPSTWGIRWLASLNSRRTPPIFPENEEDSMQVVDPDAKIDQTLSEHKNDPVKLLKIFLLTQWGTESFATHTWMLKSLLQQSRNDLETLQLFVVAADFKKMLARMKHPVSSRYLACFQRVKSMTFEPIKGALMKSYGGNDQLFLDNIPILAKVAHTKIPNLEKMAQAAMKKEPFTLYNKDTCMEFHELLCELLERFHQSLKVLKHVQMSKIQKRKEGAQSNQTENVKKQLDQVLALGLALRAMVRGGAIEVHLTTIAPFLEVMTGKFWPLSHESEDAEFRLLKPYSTDGGDEPLLPSKSYHDWLRLMVHHFDAIQVLDNHLISLDPLSSIEISIKILYPSLPDDKMLPWKQLLNNENYFPPIPLTPDQPSAAELITFLTSPTLEKDGNSIEDLIMDIDTVKQKHTESKTESVYEGFTTDIDILTEEVNTLKDSSSAGWNDYLVVILRHVEALRSDSTTHARLSQLEVISNMLENLKGSFSLYKRVQPRSSLSLGTGFTGAGHCEVYAAVSNSLSGTPGPHDGLSEETLEEFKTTGQTLGVSKRCCPACARLLILLKSNGLDRFFTSGNHTTISACTLPECLPRQIIDQMVMEFGLRLRKELVNLQKTTKVQRGRARTNDTRRISMESLMQTERESERINRNLLESFGNAREGDVASQ